MSAIDNLFQQAQLAEAAYANFINPTTGNIFITQVGISGALVASDFSLTQAASFLQNWRVISQFSETDVLDNGFSATLFERLDSAQLPTGQFTLAFEGSTWKSLGVDFVGADLDLAFTGVALNQVVSMVNYVLRLQAGLGGTAQQLTPLGTSLAASTVNGVGPGIIPSQITVSGHSLGGYLSQIYQRIFGGSAAYTYNALGVTNVDAAIFDRVTDS